MDRRSFLVLSSAAAASATVAWRAVADTRVNKTAEQLQNGEYNWFPERSPTGPILVIVSLPDQLVHVYRNGIRIAASTCSSGKSGHSTPTGVFTILQKDKHHHSSTYNNAPMPNMNRLTWSGIALHAGNLPGYPASHGCVRLPMSFSELLFGITQLGMTVVIADEASQPSSVVHPGMVLGDYAAKEFKAVDASIKRFEYAQGRTEAASAISAVISRADRSLTIWENDKVVSRGSVEIVDPSMPIGEHVYTLRRVNEGSSELTWVSANFGKDARDDDRALRRVRAKDTTLAALRMRMRQGMTLVVTDGASNQKTSATNFTVFTGGLY